MGYNMPMGSKLKEARLKRGLTMERLAEMSGISHATISRIEAGINIPNTRTLVRLATALGVSPNDLLTDYRNGI